MLSNQESVFCSDSESSRHLLNDMCRQIFTPPDGDYCDEICERCYNRCNGLCLLERKSEDLEFAQNYHFLHGPDAISINSCSRLSQDFEDKLAEVSEIKPREKVTNLVDALRGLSKSFIAVDSQDKKNQSKPAFMDNDSDINFLTPLTIDKFFLDRFLTSGTPTLRQPNQK